MIYNQREMTTQVQSNNQYSINSSNNDELQSSTQMLKFETDESIEKQIIHLEKVFKSQLSIIVNYELLTQDPVASVAGLLYYENL